MKRNIILLTFVGLWLVLPLHIWAGEIWFNYPTNGATFYTGGPTTLDIYVKWNRTLTPNYTGEVIRVKLDGDWLPENTIPPIWRTNSLGGHTYHAELWEHGLQGDLVKTAETTIIFNVLQGMQIDILTPSSAIVGGPAFELTVTGTGFASNSIVRWNGSNRTTTYISSSELRASIPASDIATLGIASVTVHTPQIGSGLPPNGGTSSSKTFVISNTVQVSVDQRLQSNVLLTGTQIGRWEGGPNFVPYTIPISPFAFTIGTTEVLQGKQDIVSNPSEKYRVWKRNSTEQLDMVQNHRGFIIRTDDANFTSWFSPTYSGVTLRNQYFDIPSFNPPTDKFHFKDPWLIDYADPDYGNTKRNRGMKVSGPDKLEFKERVLHPFIPITQPITLVMFTKAFS
jgi:hypothetical protein